MNYFADYRVQYYDRSWELAHSTEDFLTLEQITNERLIEVLNCEHAAIACKIIIYSYDDIAHEEHGWYAALTETYRVVVADPELYRPRKIYHW